MQSLLHFRFMYTRIRPSGESLTNYVAFLYVEAGYPCLKFRSFSSCITVLCVMSVYSLPSSALSNARHLSIASVQIVLSFRNPASFSVPCVLHGVVKWLTRVMERWLFKSLQAETNRKLMRFFFLFSFTKWKSHVAYDPALYPTPLPNL